MWNDRIVIEKHKSTLAGGTIDYVSYTASLYEFYYDDYGKFFAMSETPTLVGCDAETEEGALNNLKESIQLMLGAFHRIETGVNKIVHLGDVSTYDDIRNPPKPLDADDAYMDEKYGDE